MNTKPGFNAVRRNRNIGTSAQGHGQNNRHIIPSICNVGRVWGEQLNPYTLVEREVRGQQLRFFIERNNSSCSHHCSVDDVCNILNALPVTDWVAIKCYIFRQSTQTQRKLKPAWGRIFYYAELGMAGGKTIYTGPIVILEAQITNLKLKWKKSLTIDDMNELDRLRQDGHEVETTSRYHIISSNSDSIRAIQLYRTLLHEIGHWVNFTQKVEEPNVRPNANFGELLDDYFRRSSSEREAFAHHYADEVMAKLLADKIIPFSKIEE